MSPLIVRTLPAWAMAAVLISCSPTKPNPPSPPQVTVAHPHTATVTNWDEYPGHLQAVEIVEIRPRVSGYIDSIKFTDGAEVKAGDLLFVIDSKPFQAELNRAQAQRQQAETRMELAKNDLARAETLRQDHVISDEEYDARLQAAREAESALAAAKAAEDVAQLNLEYTHVTAPIPGKIGRRLVTVGNLVQGGGMMPGTLLATLVSQDPIYCYFDADEAAFLRYRNNGDQPAAAAQGVLFPCELSLGNENDFPHQGYVDFFDNQVNPQTGTIRIRAVFANADRALMPGMYATVRVPAGPPVQTLMVPAIAVGSNQGKKFVYVVNAENKVEVRSIQVDRQHGTDRMITEGLTVSDRVIVNGLMMARPGKEVEVVAAPPGAAPAAPSAR